MHHIHKYFLAILAVIIGSTDEVEVPWPVKIKRALPIVEGSDRITCIAIHVIKFLHTKNRVILVLKNCVNKSID